MSLTLSCNLCGARIGSFATPSAVLVASEEHETTCPRRTTRAVRLTEGATS